MRRALLVLSGFLLYAFAEVILLVRLGAAIGAAATLAVVLVTALVGVLVGRAQGLAVLRRWLDATADGDVPEEGLVDGLLVLAGSLLLVLPGVLGDLLGLLLLVPPFRRRVAERARRRAAGWVRAGTVEVMTLREEAPREDDVRDARGRPVIDVEGEAVEENPGRLLP